ncbi:MAG: 3-isopropylmalate dehydratase small subunit [Frondihabitans sp.]|nr:3-isopropylmalate dehydratase small subunit [Frondihabitans sp.]
MHKTTIVTGRAMPLRRSNVDTDQIIPAVFLKRVTKTGFDDALFYAWRQDPEFELNRPEYKGAKVLVAGPDFGTGSSREHAVWALRDSGFEVVLSSRFGDIFRGNSGKQGLLAAVVAEEDIEKIWAIIAESVAHGNGSPEITVDLPEQTATVADLTVSFEVDAYTKWRLLEGLDDIALTLRDEAAITEFESRRASWRPKTLPVK